MGKKKENGAPREPKPGKQEDPTLLDDIKKYAAELGFPSAHGQESDFGDFAPSKAKKKVKDASRSGDAGEHNNTEKDHKKEKKQRHQMDEKKTKKNKENAKKNEPLSFLPSIPKDAGNMKSVFSLKDEGAWYELMPDIPRDSPDSTYDDEAYLSKLRGRAARLLEVESIVAAKQDALSKNSSVAWLQQAKQGGTTSDKVAAMAVLVQEFPIAHLASLDGLVSMAGKRGGARAVVGVALDALLELWKDVLLPSDRKLKYFIQQPLSKLPSGKAADKCLVLWEFEDRLKAKYATFVEQLAVLSTDNLDFIKEKATKIAFELLLNIPEQEGQLLRIVVNKLGDPDRKIASNAGYLITKLLAHHDGMKHVVVREIENFIYRPGLQDRARYYAVVYLNQIVLSNRDKPMSLPNKKSITLGKRLVDIYFTLFKLIIDGVLGTSASIAQAKQEKKEKRQQEKALKRGKKKANANGKEEEKTVTGDRKGAMDSRMLSALITGIRRAFPYVSAEEVEPLIDAHADALFKLIHTGSFGVATQALLLLYQLMSSQSSISDRFYRALYSVLLSRELPTSTKAPLFLSLFLKAIKDDVSNKRVISFLKRLLQVSLAAPANFACGCLIVVSQICKDSPGLWNTISDPEELLDDAVPADEHDRDQIYDPSKRDPKYANAEKSCLWELVPLSKHAHPSVAAMAKTLLAGVPIQYNGDPLKDFVLAQFLDKFISKKSKPRTTTGGDSMMQPTRGRQSTHTPVLDTLESKQVAPDEAFFHQFFKIAQERGKPVKRKAKYQDVHSDDDSSLAEDDFLAGEEGDDAAYGDVDDTFDYSQLAEAMEEDRGTLTQPDKSDDDDSMSSLEGEEFPSESDEDDIDGPVHGEDEDDDNVFASLEDYSDMIAKDMDT
ncbi:Ribosome biogenesis protein NOC1 [Picochlorum sp. SENEW3]|nr:Ribosome biogenesis protein NOC1 [Picochlorum sp. SENEW3]